VPKPKFVLDHLVSRFRLCFLDGYKRNNFFLMCLPLFVKVVALHLVVVRMIPNRGGF